VSDALTGGGLVTVASGGAANGGVTIHQRDAQLLAGRLPAGGEAVVPDAPHSHVFVAVGSGELDGSGALQTGDAVRFTGERTRTFVAGDDGAELLIWATA